jgi:hypothetical protein
MSVYTDDTKIMYVGTTKIESEFVSDGTTFVQMPLERAPDNSGQFFRAKNVSYARSGHFRAIILPRGAWYICIVYTWSQSYDCELQRQRC